MTELGELAFYVSREHPCSYLDDERAVTLFADPEAELSSALYGHLIDLGFRRSGEHLYRPHCPRCSACRAVRIPIADYRPRRIDRRIVARNRDLVVSSRPAGFDEAHYALYRRYLAARHTGGGMSEGESGNYLDFLTSRWSDTEFHQFTLDGEVVMVAVTDRVERGLSAVYTFFDPALGPRSLGRFAIQWQIEACRTRGLPYLYLGYWIEACRKMRYKGEYRPLEYFSDGEWHRLD